MHACICATNACYSVTDMLLRGVHVANWFCQLSEELECDVRGLLLLLNRCCWPGVSPHACRRVLPIPVMRFRCVSSNPHHYEGHNSTQERALLVLPCSQVHCLAELCLY